MDRIPNFVARSIFALPPRLRGKPRVASWIRSYAIEIQKIEDYTAQLRAVFDPANADDYRLTILGRIVGAVREAWQDTETFRAIVLARPAENASNGHLDEINAGLANMGELSLVHVAGPRALRLIRRTRPEPGFDRAVAEVCQRLTAAGVSVEMRSVAVDREGCYPVLAGTAAHPSNCPGLFNSTDCGTWANLRIA